MPSLPPWALKLILGAVGALILMAAGAAAWDRMPFIGPHAVQVRITKERDAARQAASDWERYTHAWTASFHESERLRGQETKEARDAVNDDAKLCDARVAEARRSTEALHTLLHKEPAHDPSGCPIRELVDPDRLRDALQPRTAPGAR